MPQTITPVPQFTTANPSRPLPGEKVSMETGPAPLAPLFQTLTDRDNFLWQQAHHVLDLGGDVVVSATGVTLPRMLLSLLDGGAWKHFPFIPSGEIPHASGLAADTWYYLYVFASGGALALERSTTVPDDALMWKSSAPSTHRYLGCFRTNGASAAIPVRGRPRGTWAYRQPRDVKSWTANEALTATSLADGIPLHARRARVSLRVTNPDTTVPVYVRVFSAGTIDPPSIEHRALAAANTIPVADVDTGASRQANTIIENIGSATATLRVDTFSE